MNRANIALVPRGHRYLTRDPPGAFVRLWDLRVVPILPVCYLVAISPNRWTWTFLGLYVGAVLAARVLLAQFYRPAAPRSVTSGLEELHNHSVDARLVCYGEPVELQRIVGLSTEAFEPVIVPYHTVSRSRIEWAMIVLGLLGLVLSDLCLRFGHVGSALVSFGIVMVFAAVFHVSLSFYRVAPGKLEVLSASALTGAIKLSGSIELTQARVVCRFDKRTLEILADSGHGDRDDATGTVPAGCDSIQIDLKTVLRPHVFCEAVFRAAASEASAPQLPESEFIG